MRQIYRQTISETCKNGTLPVKDPDAKKYLLFLK